MSYSSKKNSLLHFKIESTFFKMLFHSYNFIFVFLPFTIVLFFVIGSKGHHSLAISFLVGMSLFFYGWWNPVYLALITGSILFNYFIGTTLYSNVQSTYSFKKGMLIIGVSSNLILLGYFKYANFFVENLNKLIGNSIYIEHIILPLGISFFTFQQITFLVDAYKGETQKSNFLHYCLFVTFFPQLIAGPILHHKEILPQFSRKSFFKFNHLNFAVGITIFALGFFKKIVLADRIAPYATPIFEAAELGMALTFFEAWMGALAYTFQIYFDFSGYSDMAIGMTRMVGIKLPMNFYSPYKAKNIIEFWRRWHITLSRFMKDYLYIPLGGNRKGPWRRTVNLMLTMLLAGLWHGANWTFVAWGGVHGLYIIINHAWQSFNRTFSSYWTLQSFWLTRILAHSITFFAIAVAWVFFRSESFTGAVNMLSSMALLNGFSLPVSFEPWVGSWSPALIGAGISFDGSFNNNLMNSYKGSKLLGQLCLLAWLAPNTHQFMLSYKPTLEIYSGKVRPWFSRRLEWKPNLFWAVFVVVLIVYGVIKAPGPSEFLYFQF